MNSLIKVEIEFLEKEVKLYKWNYYISFALNVVAVIGYISIIYILLHVPSAKPISDFTEINFTDLNEEEINNVKEIVKDLKPEYRELIKDLKFTKTRDEEMKGFGGMNDNGKITIFYRSNLENVRQILCHEALHQIIEYYAEEFFADDIASYEVCYKTKF